MSKQDQRVQDSDLLKECTMFNMFKWDFKNFCSLEARGIDENARVARRVVARVSFLMTNHLVVAMNR